MAGGGLVDGRGEGTGIAFEDTDPVAEVVEHEGHRQAGEGPTDHDRFRHRRPLRCSPSPQTYQRSRTHLFADSMFNRTWGSIVPDIVDKAVPVDPLLWSG
ncbi:hypothetical protein GCM10029964_050670 [Kibdelosporangium lantanae]